MMKINTLILLQFCAVLGWKSHTLVFLSTGRRNSVAQLDFEQLTVFDNVTVSKCDGLTREEHFKPLLQKREIPARCHDAHNDIWESIHTFQDHTNTSVGVVQRRRGCSREADGSVSAFEAWALNGNDFLTFDPNTLIWTSTSTLSLKVKEIWDKLTTRNYVFGSFLKIVCPERIQQMRLKSLSKNTELQMFAKPLEDSDEALLLCHVTTTDPSVKSVQLIGSGANRVSGHSVMGPLPSGGDIWILRIKAKIFLSLTHLTYGCAVQSETKNLTVYWNGTTLDGKYIYNSMKYKFLNAIIGFVAVICLILVMSCAMIALLKIIKIRKQPPTPSPRPEMREQFESFIQSSTLYPDLRNIILSVLYGANAPDSYHDSYKEWLEMVECENNYDPEFYGRWV